MLDYLPSFFAWLSVVLFFLFYRIIKYKMKIKKISSQSLPTLQEYGLASEEIFVYNSKAYWLENGKLYQADHKDVVDVKTTKIVDPFSNNSVPIDEQILILEELERRIK